MRSCHRQSRYVGIRLGAEGRKAGDMDESRRYSDPVVVRRRADAKTHIDFLKSGHLWLEIGDQVFVHGGFNPDIALSSHSAQALVWIGGFLIWPRGLEGRCRACRADSVGIRISLSGIRPPSFTRTLEPIHACNVWDLDTGAGWSGS